MADKAKNLGGRPRVCTSRLVLRLPTAFINKMASMGDQLSLDSPQASARHFMTLGMQASLGALSSQTAVAQNSELIAVVKDLLGGPDLVLDDAPVAVRPGRPARSSGGVTPNMLDTKRLNRNGKAGQRASKSKSSSN
jgi:hypothetical protein